jgi:hypothetical protein
VPLEIRNADQVVGDTPEPVALARALRDLLLERLVQPLQRQLGALAVGDVDVCADETQRLAVVGTLDLRTDADPAHFSVAWADDAIFEPILAAVAANGIAELPLGRCAIVRMDPQQPVLVRLVRCLGREAMDQEVFA